MIICDDDDGFDKYCLSKSVEREKKLRSFVFAVQSISFFINLFV